MALVLTLLASFGVGDIAITPLELEAVVEEKWVLVVELRCTHETYSIRHGRDDPHCSNATDLVEAHQRKIRSRFHDGEPGRGSTVPKS